MERLNLEQLFTPCLILDRQRMTANIERVADHAERLGVMLRPHFKTPKSIPILRQMLARQACGVAVSTLREADECLRHGITDIFYAVELSPSKLPVVFDLIERGARLRCVIDSLDAAQQLAAQARTAQPLALLVALDVDGYRCGVAPESDEALTLVAYLQSTPGLQFAGVMSYAGASYQLEQGARKAALFARHAQAMSDFCAGCDAGSAIRSLGSTPAFMHARAAQGVTEVRCGIHVFQDLFQAGMGHCRVTDIALSVLTRVISVDAARGRLFVDAGALALSKDRSTAGRDFDAGYGIVCDGLSGEPIDDWYVAAVHQEHGIVESRSGHLLADEVAIDTLLRILPNHADMTAAAYDRYFVTDGDAEVVDCWRRDNGWAPAD